MSDTLKGRVVMVTGGGSGIGRAAALVFAREGAAVLVTDIVEASAARVAGEIAAAGGKAVAAGMDVTDAGQIGKAIELAVATFGTLDGAFNNAGLPERFGRLLDAGEADYDRIMGVNVKGVWLCMRAQLAVMKTAGRGAIVNTSSTAGLKGSATMAIYTASKHAVIGLTKSAALEFAKSGIRINAICPGVVDTPMMQGVANDPIARKAFEKAQPNGRFADAREIGEAAAWLLSDAASFVTGAVMPVDGGMAA